MTSWLYFLAGLASSLLVSYSRVEDKRAPLPSFDHQPLKEQITYSQSQPFRQSRLPNPPRPLTTSTLYLRPPYLARLRLRLALV